MRALESYVPEHKVEIGRQIIEKIDTVSWNSPKEFAELFPQFDSDVRASMRQLVTVDSPLSHRRVAMLANLINYIGMKYDAVEHRAILKLIKKIWGPEDWRNIPEFLIQCVQLYIKYRRIPLVLEGLRTYLTEEFTSNWESFKDLSYLDDYIKEKQSNKKKQPREDELKILTEIQVLSDRLDRIKLVESGQLEFNGKEEDLQRAKDLAERRLNYLRSLVSEDWEEEDIIEDDIARAKIIKAIITERGRKNITDWMNLSMNREEPDKITVFIALVKLYA